MNKENSLRVDVYGSFDKLKLGIDSVDDSDPEVTGSFGYDTQFNSLITHWHYKDGPIDTDFSPG